MSLPPCSMGDMPKAPAPLELHPAIAAWFAARFPEGPTEAQAQAGRWCRADPTCSWPRQPAPARPWPASSWPSTRPTGLTKPVRTSAGRTRVVYVSPLKALAVDVQQNLERPLAEIAEAAERLGLPCPRSPSPSARATRPRAPAQPWSRTLRRILVTTPESLYLYLTAERSRQTLTGVRTVIVDEIHALARDKRGSHLALSLERLEHIQLEGRPQRVGLSATQRPIEVTARLLSGAGRRLMSTMPLSQPAPTRPQRPPKAMPRATWRSWTAATGATCG